MLLPSIEPAALLPAKHVMKLLDRAGRGAHLQREDVRIRTVMHVLEHGHVRREVARGCIDAVGDVEAARRAGETDADAVVAVEDDELAAAAQEQAAVADVPDPRSEHAHRGQARLRVRNHLGYPA